MRGELEDEATGPVENFLQAIEGFFRQRDE